jgi:hypothetical protein
MEQTTSGKRPSPNGQDRPRLERLRERGAGVRRDARVLATDVEQAVEEIHGFLREQLEQRPYAVLAAASGIGYVLGGGLPTRLVRLMFDLGTRVALTALVGQVIPKGETEPSSSAA